MFGCFSAFVGIDGPEKSQFLRLHIKSEFLL